MFLPKRDSIKLHFVRNHLHDYDHQFSGALKYFVVKFWRETKKKQKKKKKTLLFEKVSFIQSLVRVITKRSTLLITLKTVGISLETVFLHKSEKYFIQEITSDLKNHQKHQNKFNFCDFLDLGQVGHTLQSLFMSQLEISTFVA